MRLTVLVENTVLTGSCCLGEAGLSILVEADGKRILFDVGYSRLLVDNAKKLGIALEQIDLIALSHGHQDHTAGFDALRSVLEQAGRKVPVQLHPEALAQRWDADGDSGFAFDRVEFARAYAPRFSREPVALTERLLWLGEIPRRYAFEARSFGMRDGEVDFVPDDTALVYRHEQGLVILSGCAHSGICNIVDYAVAYTGEERVLDVVGGFHLPQVNGVYLGQVCETLRMHRLKQLHPCHCTGLPAKLALDRVAPVGEVGVGTVLTY